VGVVLRVWSSKFRVSVTGDILELDLPENSFDLIYSYQVFEHIAEPRRIIRRLTRLLKDDGMLLIHTDMETPERFQSDFTNWWYVLPPDHCSYYTHQTFEKMFERYGCRLIYKNPKVVMASKV
jgi:ubiquinone/menaquinone biosynthesis C-methylase UbiE